MHEDDNEDSPAQGRLHDLLTKVLMYQHSLPDGRAVELEELLREGVFGPEEMEFMRVHSITYKPHRVSDFHALDMFHMPTEGGGCTFIGPAGPPLKRRGVALNAFERVVKEFLELPRPKEDLVLQIELESAEDGMGVAPGFICFTLRSADGREQLPRIREVADDLRLRTFQDEEIQSDWILSFHVPTADAVRTSAAVVALLRRGCGLGEEREIIYSAGALDEGEGNCGTGM
jgi:hypothetical protein